MERRTQHEYARRAIASSPRLQRVLGQIFDGRFSPEEPGRYHSLIGTLYDHDYFLVTCDFDSYFEEQRRADAAYRDTDRWTAMALQNTASMGWFSSEPDDQRVCARHLACRKRRNLGFGENSMNTELIPRDTVLAIAGGAHGDPFSVLGMHSVDGRLSIRCFHPEADTVEVLDQKTGRKLCALSRVEPEDGGVFAGFVPRRKKRFSYLLRLTRGDDTWTVQEPVRVRAISGRD